VFGEYLAFYQVDDAAMTVVILGLRHGARERGERWWPKALLPALSRNATADASAWRQATDVERDEYGDSVHEWIRIADWD